MNSPAFPTDQADMKGMTLRQWYAGQAMLVAGACALVGAVNGELKPQEVLDKMAKDSFAFADSMIEYEEKEKFQ